MAIMHLSVKIISRSTGRSAVASAAYRSGTTLVCEETEIVYSYEEKGGIEYSEIMLPKNAPKEYADRQTLWNAVEKIEKASNARLAREVQVAIPKELNTEQGQELVRNFVKKEFVSRGMGADFSIHDKGDGNRHAHIMLTTRSIQEDGAWAPKSRKVYHLDDDGNKVVKKRDKNGRIQYDCHTEDYNDWNRKENVEQWRVGWAKSCNQYLDQRHQIDHRSFERQGIERIPTIHEGFIARQIEKSGGISEKCQINRDIHAANVQLNNIDRELGQWELIRSRIAEELEKAKDRVSEKVRELNDRFRRLRTDRTNGTNDEYARTATAGTEPERPENSGTAIDHIEQELRNREIDRISREAERREQSRERTRAKEQEHEAEDRNRESHGRSR